MPAPPVSVRPSPLAIDISFIRLAARLWISACAGARMCVHHSLKPAEVGHVAGRLAAQLAPISRHLNLVALPTVPCHISTATEWHARTSIASVAYYGRPTTTGKIVRATCAHRANRDPRQRDGIRFEW